MPQDRAGLQNIKDRLQGRVDNVRARTGQLRENFQQKRESLMANRGGGLLGSSSETPGVKQPGPVPARRGNQENFL